MAKVIVVFGATGVQGKGFIQGLAAHNTPTVQYRIFALTRNPTSSSSKALANYPGVELLKVDADVMDNPRKVFMDLTKQGVAKGAVYGVWSVQGYVDDKTMFRQGCAIADAASEAGVKHFIYSSSDFGGMKDCGIAGFEIKRTTENHIRTLPMAATFIRPSQFMEVWLPTTPFEFKMGRTVAAKFALTPNPKMKHYLVAGGDVGRAGAEAILRGPKWRVGGEEGIVRVAGEGLTIAEIEARYKEVLGTQVPYAPILLVRIVKTIVPILGSIITFFGQHGYNIPVQEVRNEMPWIMDYRTFLQKFKSGEL